MFKFDPRFQILINNFDKKKNRFSDDGLYSQIQGGNFDFSDQEWEGASEDSKELVAE